MAFRGIEKHGSSITLPSQAMPFLSIGRWGDPIDQIVAGQIMVSGVIENSALGGDITGGYFGSRVGIAMTGDIYGVRARASVLVNVALTGAMYGIKTELELGGVTTTISGITCGHTIEIYAEVGCTFGPDLYGLYINNYITAGGAAAYQLIRLETGGTLVPSAIIGVYVNDATYFLHLTPNAPAAGGWVQAGDRTAGSATNAAGWLLVELPAGDRYIQLFT